MIANNNIVTLANKAFELKHVYYSPSTLLDGENFSSLYAFVSYKDPWNETILTATIQETKIRSNVSFLFGSNEVSILGRNNLSDFFVGQKIVSPYFTNGTTIEELDDLNMNIILSSNSSSNFIGEVQFLGMNQNDLLTISPLHNSAPISEEDDFYKNTAVNIAVNPDDVGGLTYIKNVIEYDGNTKTLRVDSPMNDFPGVTPNTTIRLFYNNSNPPKPIDTVKYSKEIFKNLVYMKKLSSNDFSPVIERINWTSGQIYDYFQDDVNMGEKLPNGKLKRKFYVMNSFYQVFKCLWNNNESPSTVEPYFVSGNFDDSTSIFYDPVDGYKWKYMFTVPGNKIQRFIDSNYIPLGIQPDEDLSNSPEWGGGIEVINVIDGGVGYNDLASPITVKIEGDGTGAVARVDVNRTANTIRNIVMTSVGSNYTYANVSIISNLGSGASIKAGISSIGGSGSNIIKELGCEKIMIACQFDQTNDTDFPSDFQIRQFGILLNPQSYATKPNPANNFSYILSDVGVVSPGFGSYQRGEIVYQSNNNSNFANASFVGTCVNFDDVSNSILIVNTRGTHILNSTLFGLNSGTSRTLLSRDISDIVKYSGDIIFIQNIEEIQRSPDSLELFRVVLNF